MSVINQKTGPPTLGRSKSGDGLPRPTRNADFKKSKSSDGLNSSNSRLSSLIEEERPKCRPNASSVASAPLVRSSSGDVPRPPPVRNLQRSKSGDGIPRPVPLVPPSPSTIDGKQVAPASMPPQRDTSMGGGRIPPPPLLKEYGVERTNSGNFAAMTPFSPQGRVPPLRARSMNPNVGARTNQMAPNGVPSPRPMSSEQVHSLPAQSPGNLNRRPSPPQRAPSLQVQRAVNPNSQPSSTPTRDHANTTSPLTQRSQQPQQPRPVPSPRVPSPRQPESGTNNNNNGPFMAVPSTPKRTPEMRAVPRTTSNGTPKRPMPPPQPNSQSRPLSPQRTISLPVNSKNVPPNRPTAVPPTKIKMDSGGGDRTSTDVMMMSSPTRTKSMPIKPTQAPSNGNHTNTATQLSPIT